MEIRFDDTAFFAPKHSFWANFVHIFSLEKGVPPFNERFVAKNPINIYFDENQSLQIFLIL